MTNEEMIIHLNENKINIDEVFHLIKLISNNSINSLNYIHEHKCKSIDLLTNLINVLRLKI